MATNKLGAVALLAAFIPLQGYALTIVTYTDRTGFGSNFPPSSSGIVREDFNSATLETFSTAFSKDYGDFTISSTDVAGDTIGILNQRFGFSNSYNPVSGAPNIDGTKFFGLHGSGGGPTFKISFDSPRYVFGFDYVDSDGTDSYAVTLLGQQYENPPFGRTFQGTGFFGMISDTPFTEVVFGQTAAGGAIGGFGIDNLTTSTQFVQDPGISVVPEVSSALAIGLLCAAGTLRRSRRG